MRMQGFHTCRDPAGFSCNQRLSFSIFYLPGIILLAHICKRLLTPMKSLVNYLKYTWQYKQRPDEIFLALFETWVLIFLISIFRPFKHQARFDLVALHKLIPGKCLCSPLVEGQQGVQYHSPFPAAKISAWNMIFVKSNQVSSPFTWNKQVLNEYIKTVM